MTSLIETDNDSPPATNQRELAETAAAARFEKFRWHGASVLMGLFGGALFDQVALPSVAAGVESTGRIRNATWARAIRTAASDQLVFWGTEADRRAEFSRLKLLHRDVKGVTDDGERYSALSPESWNWILTSTFFMMHNSYTPMTGERLTADDDQAFWEYFKAATVGLHLPGKSALPETYCELRENYDEMARTRLRANDTLDNAVDSLLSPPRPDFIPAVASPLWRLIGPVAGHGVCILSFGIMHPGVRALTRVRWTRRHEIEFRVLTAGVRFAFRHLPKRLQYSPLAYNRWRYEELSRSYRSLGLTSFAPDTRSRGCPI